ncbi:flavocytochrome c [Globicatella sanguinis]|uniref:flavocytochrome c n=1 Tax=Globicatella sanguinis TaxID=13076 RepID=UPI0025439E81|nr:flavocytochrome c [Globicatella sanguinis]MDK7631712.1 flavocytochrome c [Globicatella sanguinis]WIK67088.1 flavocytochrome c [Globicatella sanguinis]WKT56493.1 flavocytochrome c [Globicatella sanguinis]
MNLRKWAIGLISTALLSAPITTALAEEADTTSGASQTSEWYADPATLKESYDIVIIGAGGGGMAAAITAQEAGADVAIFEKMPIAGGNTSKSSGGMNASETKFQKEQGIEDSNDLFYEDTLEGGKGTNDPELLRYMVDHSAEAIDWLDSIGITLNNITFSGGASVKRIHRPEDGSAVGGYLVEGLLRNIHEKEIPLFVNSEVTKINETDGRVSGVNVTVEGEEKTINAKAVIIATGGFGGNLEMVSEIKPELEGFVTTNHEGATGDGIRMAEELGAAVVDMDQIQIHPTVEQSTSYLVTESVRGDGGILVNQQGERFTDELLTRDKVSANIIALPEKYAYIIADQRLKESVTAINQYEEKGIVTKAETIEELAEKLEIPAENLKATLDTWNEAVKNQEDKDFGRTTGMEYDLSHAPYYAIKIAPGIHHTMGGLKIDTETHVLREDGTAIEGLFGAGEVTGQVHGSNRIGGNAVADIIVFGRQAGNIASEYVKQ